MVSETFSAVSAPIQYAAIAAYTKSESLMDHIELCSKIHSAAGKYLHKRFTGMGLNCPEPEGAFYLFPDFENFKKGLINQGIMLGL